MAKKEIGAGAFAAYILIVCIAFFFDNDRVVILCTAIMTGFSFVFRMLYVEESEQIIRFFDRRINETIDAFKVSIDKVHERIDNHHPKDDKND